MSDIDSALLYGKATPQQRIFLEEALQLGLDFVEGGPRAGKVLQYQSEDSLRQRLSQPLPLEGMSLDELMQELHDNVVRYCVAQGDVRYLAFPDSGNSVAGLGADIISAFLNQNLIAFDRSAPSGTFVEMQLLQWLRELVGYSHRAIDAQELMLSDVGGLWTSGGNMSNHVAVLVALHAKFPEIKKCGLRGLHKRPVIVLAEGIEHFSYASAALSLGLGQDNLIWTKSKHDYTTDPQVLHETISQLDDDCEPFMVVSVAGNCRTTSIDDINAIHQVCESFRLWLHVDACHGANLLFSQHLRSRLNGLEHADSVSLDPHKGLFVTYPCSYVLFKDPQVLQFICRYPDKFSDPSCLDLGLIMPFFGSRGFHSLKLWALIKHLGVEGIGNLIEHRQQLNDSLVRKLDDSGWFQLLNDGSFYRTAFVFFPREVRKLAERKGLFIDEPKLLRSLVNRYTQLFSDAIYHSGEVVFDAFSLADLDNRVGLGTAGKYVCMAMAIGHPTMDQHTEEKIFASIDQYASPLAVEMAHQISIADRTHIPSEKITSKGPAGW